jgi:uncharacterized protein
LNYLTCLYYLEEKMKVTIIGGSGLIGQALAKELLNNGHAVTILTRRSVASDQETKISWKQWDGKTAESLQSLLSGQDAVVNLAGESIGKGVWTDARKEALRESRIQPAHAIVAACSTADEKPSVVVQASAIGYYGIGDQPFDESSPHGNDYLSQLAVEWETASEAVEGTGIRRVVIRTGVVLAKEEGALPQLMLPFRLFVGGPVGSGKQWLSWIHIEDEARAIQFLIEHSDCKGVYNLAAPNPVTNQEMGKALGKVMRRPYWFPVPGFLLKLGLGEMSTLVLDGQKVVPSRLLGAGFEFKFKNVNAALESLLS